MSQGPHSHQLTSAARLSCRDCLAAATGAPSALHSSAAQPLHEVLSCRTTSLNHSTVLQKLRLQIAGAGG